MYGGRLYYHIFDTTTGYPADTDVFSATVIAGSAELADALSIAVLCLGVSEGLTFIETLPGVEAVIINDRYELFYTSGIGSKIPIEKIGG
jgi:thiamine biosynthesis lipoprotein